MAEKVEREREKPLVFERNEGISSSSSRVEFHLHDRGGERK